MERTVARHAIAGAGGGGSEEEAPEALQLRAQLIRLRRARALRLPPTCFLLESLRRQIGHGQCEEQEVCKEVRGPCRGGRVPLGDESGGEVEETVCMRAHARTHAFVREWAGGRACVRVGGLRLLELVD